MARVEAVPFADSQLGKRVASIAATVASAAETVRKAFAGAAADARPGRAVARPAYDARGTMDRFVAAAKMAANRPLSLAEFKLGRWDSFRGTHPESTKLGLQIRSDGARYGRTTSGLGLDPYAWGYGQLTEITPLVIADGHRRSTQTGWVDRKIDIHSRFLREDSHVGGVDQIRRSVFYRAPFRIAPKRGDARPVALLLANAVRAAMEHCDGFRTTCASIDGAMTGFGLGECVWRPEVKLAVPAGNRVIVVESEVITSVEPVGPRYVAFDAITERPYLCYGPSEYVDITEQGLQKFLFVVGDGQAALPTRFRGWGWANDWLSYLGALDLEKLGILVETFGVATPYLQRNDQGIVTDEEAVDALRVLESIGTGEPAIIPSRLGELKHTEVPAGLAPIHAQMMEMVRTEQSKRILSSTLQTSVSSNGSWAAADVHEGQETKVSHVDAFLMAEAWRTQAVRWIVDVNARAWASAFSRYIPGGVTPDDLKNIPLDVEFVISDDNPTTRMAVFQAASELGVVTDPEQIREEGRIRAPLPELQLQEIDAPEAALPAPAVTQPSKPAARRPLAKRKAK